MGCISARVGSSLLMVTALTTGLLSSAVAPSWAELVIDADTVIDSTYSFSCYGPGSNPGAGVSRGWTLFVENTSHADSMRPFINFFSSDLSQVDDDLNESRCARVLRRFEEVVASTTSYEMAYGMVPGTTVDDENNVVISSVEPVICAIPAGPSDACADTDSVLLVTLNSNNSLDRNQMSLAQATLARHFRMISTTSSVSRSQNSSLLPNSLSPLGNSSDPYQPQ